MVPPSSVINESIDIRAELAEIKMIHQQEIKKLHKMIADLEFRVNTVEGLTT